MDLYEKATCSQRSVYSCQLAECFRQVYVEIAKNQNYKIVSDSVLSLTIKWPSLLGRILLISFYMNAVEIAVLLLLKSPLVTMFPRSRPIQASRLPCSFNPNNLYNTTAVTGSSLQAHENNVRMSHQRFVFRFPCFVLRRIDTSQVI